MVYNMEMGNRVSKKTGLRFQTFKNIHVCRFKKYPTKQAVQTHFYLLQAKLFYF